MRKATYIHQWGAGRLSSASDKICEWSLSVATSCVHKVCTPTTSMSSTSTSSPSCCIERGKIRDRELCNRWLYCWRRLVGCVALGCECSKLLLRGLLICMELVDCCRYQCWSFCRCSCRELTLGGQRSYLGDDCLYVIILLFKFFLENIECVLHISVCPTCDAWCIQSTRVAFLNKRLEINPDPVATWLLIPIFKIPCV